MAVVTLDLTAWRALFSAFDDNPPYTDALIEQAFATACVYIDPGQNYMRMLHGAALVSALYQLTAHILALGDLIAAGLQPGFTTDAQIDKIKVSSQAPPGSNEWLWWLNTTPYGMGVAALLTVKSVGGIYVGGLPERDAIRRVGGGFGGIPPWGRP